MNNKEKGVCIYLAIPIDKHPDEPDRVREEYATAAQAIANHLDTLSIFSTIFLPGRAYVISGAPTDNRDVYVIGINDFALVEADFMVVAYRPGVESWGVPQEVDKAWRQEIPVILLLGENEPTLMARGDIPMYLRHKISAVATCYKDLAKIIQGNLK